MAAFPSFGPAVMHAYSQECDEEDDTDEEDLEDCEYTDEEEEDDDNEEACETKYKPKQRKSTCKAEPEPVKPTCAPIAPAQPSCIPKAYAQPQSMPYNWQTQQPMYNPQNYFNPMMAQPPYMPQNYGGVNPYFMNPYSVNSHGYFPYMMNWNSYPQSSALPYCEEEKPVKEEVKEKKDCDCKTQEKEVLKESTPSQEPKKSLDLTGEDLTIFKKFPPRSLVTVAPSQDGSGKSVVTIYPNYAYPNVPESKSDVKSNSINLKQTNDTNFDKDVIQPSANKTILVLFFQSSCGPCQRVKQLLSQLPDSIKDKDSIYMVDAAQNLNLIQKYNINATPILAMFKNGQIIKRKSGTFKNMDALQNWITSN